MTDWKQKIDAYYADQAKKAEEESQRKIEMDERMRREQEKERIEIEAKEEARNLERLGRKFQCHICHKPSIKPARHSHLVFRGFGSDWGPGDYESVDDGPYWGQPGDLIKCSKCNRWTCDNCMWRGICKKCSEQF